MNVLKPREPVPALDIETLSGPWSLADQNPDNFIVVVFYRGLHCPICAKYVHELAKLEGDFTGIGTVIVTLSQDTRERAKQAVADWELGELTVGYGINDDTVRAWGLHRSAGRGKTSIGIEEPAEFNEPGLFIIRPDKTLYWAQISTMPFARPHFREILGALKFAIEKDYPARGELS